MKIGKPFRQRRTHAAGRLDGVGKFGRMRGRQHHHRHGRIARFLLGDGDADRGVRVDEVAGLAFDRADGGGDFVLVGAAGDVCRENLFDGGTSLPPPDPRSEVA